MSSETLSLLLESTVESSTFEAWTRLLAEAERCSASAPEMRNQAFDRFLALYPLCYGYWIKFAKLLEAAGDYKTSNAIYKRGCEAVKESVDMWTGYCGALVAWHAQGVDFAGDDNVRNVFEDAVKTVGRHPDAGTLWRAYAAFEPQAHERALVYARAVAEPLRDGDSLLIELEMLCQDGNPKLGDILRDAKGNAVKARSAFSSRQHFECKIASRPYFHVTPVPEDLQRAWSSYIDFAINDETCAEDLEFLFRRCMIVCARYPQFWIKYALWSETNKSNDEVASIYERAMRSCEGEKPSIYMAYAEYLECAGRVAKARDVFDQLHHKEPTLVEAIVKRAHFERRQRCEDSAEDLLRKAMDTAETSEVKAYLAVQLANIASASKKKEEYIRKIYTDIRHSRSVFYWTSFADFELHASSGGLDSARRVFESAIETVSQDGDDLWQLFIELEATYGDSMKRLHAIKARYQKWKWAIGNKKRSASNGSVVAPSKKRKEHG